MKHVLSVRRAAVKDPCPPFRRIAPRVPRSTAHVAALRERGLLRTPTPVCGLSFMGNLIWEHNEVIEGAHAKAARKTRPVRCPARGASSGTLGRLARPSTNIEGHGTAVGRRHGSAEMIWVPNAHPSSEVGRLGLLHDPVTSSVRQL